ncbi:MAG: hypothetical protein ABI432_03325 [Flavobacteriales bacterium]
MTQRFSTTFAVLTGPLVMVTNVCAQTDSPTDARFKGQHYIKEFNKL